MMTRRTVSRVRRLAMVGSVLLFALNGHVAAADSNESARAIPAHRDAKDPRWVFGSVIVDSPPDEVWARFERVDTWPRLLSDIARMKVVDHRDAHWGIELETKTLGHGMLGYDVETSPERVIKLSTDKLGVHALAYTRIHPGPQPGQSLVSYSLYLQVNGAPSLLISDKTLREKQDHMVAVTLADIGRGFGSPSHK